MAAGVRITFDYHALGRLLRGTEIAGEAKRRAENMASAARGVAPVQDGDYRDSIDAQPYSARTRAGARVYAHSDHATSVESRHNTLASVVEAAR